MPIKYDQVKFVRSYGTAEQLPGPCKPEVSFVGRSNVGKSSLINCLFHRKSLAKTSSTPGKTTTINFFEADGIYFVDLPGYGFAKRGRGEKQRWADMIEGYYEQGRSFNLVIVLVDIRHDMQALDRQMVDYLEGRELPFVIALTKADKLSKSKQSQQLARLSEQFGIDREQMIVTSSAKGIGMKELKRAIEAACL